MLNETTTRQPGATNTGIFQILSGEDGVWQESPLVAMASAIASRQAGPAASFEMRERPFVDLVSIRGVVSDTLFTAAVSQVVGCEVPAVPNTVAHGEAHDMLWLGPDEWMVVGKTAGTGALGRGLATALSGQFASAVDVSSGYTIVSVSGRAVRDVLSRGCPLDVDANIFGIGTCAQTHYFKASIILIRTGEDVFDIIVRRSFADYFCRILLDAAESVAS
ncbi:sarcosine oxidase subunit gamma [Paraburkholderia sp. GAS42]|jgi:sarcosine oxidase subunit gamma|uniref:sarcosine oxidase subunit gamma n=1 Tax=Paraburkholderia sp. GAS42 TaxID=3035135 RepID=UPI003D1B2186